MVIRSSLRERGLYTVSYTHLDVYKRQGEGISLLKDEILKRLKANLDFITLDVPYSRGDVMSLIHKLAKNSSIEYLPECAKVQFSASREDAGIIVSELNKTT